MHWLLRAGVRSSPPPSMPPPRAARRLLRTARHLQTAAAPSWQPPEQHETPAAEELELRDELA
eukprot:COSAG06_NODE_35024_length_465_cov_2.005464_1_plen_62_part_01